MYSSQRSSWLQQMNRALDLTKHSWANEQRKYLLTIEEINQIDEQFFKFTDVVNTYNGTPQDYNRFMSEYTRLKNMVRRAETKMGYISLSF